jgi:hypothetical protein
MPIVNGQWVAPQNSDFKARFFRDFPYAPAGETSQQYVQDQDLTNASAEAQMSFNAGIFSNNADTIFYFLWAHHLCLNLQNAIRGIGSQAQFAQESGSVGSASVTNQIAEQFKNDPVFSSLLATAYGRKYLEMAYPYTVGGMQLIVGNTTAA